jgi:hypothetical protein
VLRTLGANFESLRDIDGIKKSSQMLAIMLRPVHRGKNRSIFKEETR